MLNLDLKKSGWKESQGGWSWFVLTFGEKGNAQILHDLFSNVGYYDNGYNDRLFFKSVRTMIFSKCNLGKELKESVNIFFLIFKLFNQIWYQYNFMLIGASGF